MRTSSGGHDTDGAVHGVRLQKMRSRAAAGLVDEIFLLAVIEFDCCPSQCGEAPSLGLVRRASDGSVIGATEHAATIRRARSGCSSRSRRGARNWLLEIVHDGRLTASCRNPWLIRQSEWAIRSADSCQGPIASGRNTINLQVPDGQMGSCTARMDRCVA